MSDGDAGPQNERAGSIPSSNKLQYACERQLGAVCTTRGAMYRWYLPSAEDPRMKS